jgi:hypothetical protein
VLQVQGDLYYEDLQKLSSDDVAAVFDWVLEKVDGLAASWKDNPEAKPEESAQLADVDLFALSEDGTALRVHPVWLGHLQVPFLSFVVCLGHTQHPANARDASKLNCSFAKGRYSRTCVHSENARRLDR